MGEMTSPHQVDFAPHVSPRGCRLAGDVVGDGVVLEADSHSLVPSHAAADLPPANVGAFGCGLRSSHGSHPSLYCGPRVPKVGVLFAALSGLCDAGRDMRHPTGVLVLVAMLAALASAGEPGHAEVSVGDGLNGLNAPRLQNGYRNGAGVDAPALFGGRYTLYSMPTSFPVKAVTAGPVDFKADLEVTDLALPLGKAAGLSTTAQTQFLESNRQFPGELLRILSALGGPDLDNPFHGTPPTRIHGESQCVER